MRSLPPPPPHSPLCSKTKKPLSHVSTPNDNATKSLDTTATKKKIPLLPWHQQAKCNNNTLPALNTIPAGVLSHYSSALQFILAIAFQDCQVNFTKMAIQFAKCTAVCNSQDPSLATHFLSLYHANPIIDSSTSGPSFKTIPPKMAMKITYLLCLAFLSAHYSLYPLFYTHF